MGCVAVIKSIDIHLTIQNVEVYFEAKLMSMFQTKILNNLRCNLFPSNVSKKSILNLKVINNFFSQEKFEEEFERACSEVCEIVPQMKGPKPSIISIYKEKPKPTLGLEEIACTLQIPKNIIVCCESCVGPGASKRGVYKNPEYFCYHRMSYYDAMKNLHQFRVPDKSKLDPCYICESIKK